jgi:biopolymer transport protein ExbD
MKVNLPKVVTSEVIRDENIVIVVSSDNFIYLERSDQGSDEILQPFGSQDDPSARNNQQKSSMGHLDNQVIDLRQLKIFLEHISRRKGTILIKADKGVSLGRVVEIWDLCRESGITQINIATD